MSKQSRLRHALDERRAGASDTFWGGEEEGWGISHGTRRKREHPATSEAAYETIRPRQVTDKARVRELLRVWPSGATRKEIAVQRRISENTVNGRVAELRAARLVYVSGQRDRCGIVIARQGSP